jgi:hypothetical protein
MKIFRLDDMSGKAKDHFENITRGDETYQEYDIIVKYSPLDKWLLKNGAKIGETVLIEERF